MVIVRDSEEKSLRSGDLELVSGTKCRERKTVVEMLKPREGQEKSELP